MTRWTELRVLMAAGVLAGCVSGNDASSGGNDDDGDGPSRRSTPGEIRASNVVAKLARADSCDDLLSRIHDDVAAKVELQAELMRNGQNGVVGGGGVIGQPVTGPAFGGPTPDFAGGAAGMGGAAPMLPSSMVNPGTTPTPNAPPSSGNAGEGTSNLGPTDHSDTNTQVEGVDEADIVKTDGRHVWMLHGNTLFVLDSWPAAETAVTGSIDIEGTVSEMFVHDGMAAVFSTLWNQGDLIDAKDPVAGGVANPYYGGQFTKITLIDVGDEGAQAQPRVVRQLLIEGTYLSARRHDTTVRAVIQGGFRNPTIYGGYIEYTDPWGRPYPQDEIDAQIDTWRDRTITAVERTELSDWLPIEREIVGGELTEPTRRCTDFYAPSPGLTNYGLTNVVAFDLHDPESELSGAIVLGATDEVYSNESVLVLAHRDWRWDQGLIERERTVLHRFELTGAATTYTASGFVPGHIVDQFSIDERDGIVRISTSQRILQNFTPIIRALAEQAAEDDDDTATIRTQTDNRVLALDVSGDRLVRAGITEPLGEDGETIFSTRFVGDRGYVVTFRQTDPLIVVDLADPSDLSVLGEVMIPGFSDYMHPLGPNHLVTIGRDATTTGMVQGLMLQIFDVTDPSAPRRTHTYEFGANGYSEANVNHKAFTFHRPEGALEGEGLLAFPYVNYGTGYGYGSSLEVFEVSSVDGFDKLGAVDHTGVLETLCGTYFDSNFQAPVFIQCVSPEVRRGLFIFGEDGEFVYSISNAGVLVNELSDLATPVATVALPVPDFAEHRRDYGSGTGSTATTTTPATSTTPPVMTTPAPTPIPEAGAGG